jgi:hypothetical protein
LFDGRHILGNNLYAYCGNDPVNYVDSEGRYRIREDRTRKEIEQKSQAALEAIRAKRDFLKKNPDGMAFIADHYYDDFTDAFMLGVFEIAVDDIKQNGLLASIYVGHFGAALSNSAVILTIKEYVMIYDFSFPINRYEEFLGVLGEYSKNYNSTWGSLSNLLIVFFGALGQEYTNVGMSDIIGDNINHGATQGFFSNLFDGDSSADLKKQLTKIFWSISDSYFEGVLVFNYKKIYGKGTNKFWEEIG